MQEAPYQRLVQKTEAIYLADNAKNLPIVDEHLYYAVDLKQKTIEMTEKGRDFITNNEEGSEFFVIPDLGTESSIMGEEIERLTKERIEEIENNNKQRDDYKAKRNREIRNEVKEQRE